MSQLILHTLHLLPPYYATLRSAWWLAHADGGTPARPYGTKPHLHGIPQMAVRGGGVLGGWDGQSPPILKRAFIHPLPLPSFLRYASLRSAILWHAGTPHLTHPLLGNVFFASLIGFTIFIEGLLTKVLPPLGTIMGFSPTVLFKLIVLRLIERG
jgi:hypothetical protein